MPRFFQTSTNASDESVAGSRHKSATPPPRASRPEENAKRAATDDGHTRNSGAGDHHLRPLQHFHTRHNDHAALAAAETAASSSAHSYRLHYDFVESTLTSKADTLDRATYFVFYVLFVIGFGFFYLLEVNVPARYQLRHSLLDTLAGAEMPRLKSAKLFSELSSADEYGQYIVHSVAPLLATVLAPTGSSIPLGYLRVRTQRSVTIGCDSLPADRATSLYTILNCKDSSVSTVEDTEAVGQTRFDLETLWSYRSCKQLGGNRYTRIRGALGTYHCGGFLLDVPIWVQRTAASIRTHSAVVVPPDSSNRVSDSSASTAWPETRTTSLPNTSDNSTADLPPTLGTAEQAFPFTDGSLSFQRIALSQLQSIYLKPLFWDASTPFVDNYATRMVVTEVLFYNPALQRFAAVKLMGEVTSSGSWTTTALLRSARVWTRDDTGKGIFYAVVMAMTVVWLISFVAEGVMFVRRRVAERREGGGADAGARLKVHRESKSGIDGNRSNSMNKGSSRSRSKGKPMRTRDTTGLSYSSVATVRVMAAAEYLFSAQNLMTFAIVALLVVLVGCRIASIVYSVRSVPTLDVLISMTRYPMQLEYLFYLDQCQLYVGAVVLILLFYRGLCFVTFNTHAARVVRLLARAQSALCGYIFLSLLTTTAYAMTLTTLFGTSVWSFRSVDAAFYTLLRVMTRQHDINALTKDSGEPTTVAFVLFSYQIMGVLVLFSLAAGVLVHSFNEMRKEEPSPVLAGYQIRWLLRRAWRCVSQPRWWPRWVWRWCGGYGDAALLRHAARCLRSYRAATYPALDHVEGELRQLLGRDEFVEAMHHDSDALHMAEAATPFFSFSPTSSTGAGAAGASTPSGIWMTWTTRSSSEATSCTPSLGVGSRTGRNVDDVDADQRRQQPLHQSRHRNRYGEGDGSTSNSDIATLHSRASLAYVSPTGTAAAAAGAAAEARERQRRRWQQRWASYPVTEMWQDVFEDWLASTTSEASLHYREEVVWLRNGVQSAVGDNLSHAKAFPQRLAELERKLRLLESHFRENELTTTASDKADRDEKSDGPG